MRHLRSIFYALVLAPAIWVLAGVGFTHDLTSRGRELFAAESISGLLLLIFSGILYAILAFAPVSPAGPVLAGAGYMAVTIWAWNSPEAYASLWAPEISKAGFDLSRPGYGLAALLAIPLLGTALSARRWARYEPPVLPIIGEVGRFRGAAKAPGIPVSIAETTVLRAGRTGDPTVPLTPAAPADLTMPTARAVPAPADATLAMPATPAVPADHTLPMTAAPAAPQNKLAVPAAAPAAHTSTKPTAASADLTVAMPAAAPAAHTSTKPTAASADLTVAMPVAAASQADATVAVPGLADRTAATPAAGVKPTVNTPASSAGRFAVIPDPVTIRAAADSDGAWDPSIAVRTPEAEPTTVFVVSEDETTAVAARPATAGIRAKSPTNNSAINTNSDISEIALAAEAEEQTAASPAAKPAENKTTAPLVTDPKDDEETMRPPTPAGGDEATQPAILKADEETSRPAAPDADEETSHQATPQADEETSRLPSPENDEETSHQAAPENDEETSRLVTGEADEETSLREGDEATSVLVMPEPGELPSALDEKTHKLLEAATLDSKIAATPEGSGTSGAGGSARDRQAIQAGSTDLGDLADDPTTPLRLPSLTAANGDEPTAYIPAQRRPSPTEA